MTAEQAEDLFGLLVGLTMVVSITCGIVIAFVVTRLNGDK